MKQEPITLDALYKRQDDLAEQWEDVEAELSRVSMWLSALRGPDDSKRRELLDNAEFATADLATLDADSVALLKRRHEIERAQKETAETIERLEKEESAKARADRRRRAKEAFVKGIELLVEFSEIKFEERRVVADDRFLPDPLQEVLPHLSLFNKYDPSSGLNYAIREGVRLGYITGREPWLADVNWTYT
jgi:hypothetical protein